jgi:cytochrome P450
MQGLNSGPVWEWWMRVMFSQNPPDHTRLRRLVNRAFTPRRVKAIEDEISTQVSELLRPALEAGRLEVISEVSHVLASNVVAAYIGIPRSDWGVFRQWTTDIGLAFGAAGDDQTRVRVEAALSELNDYVEGLLRAKRAAPEDDLLSVLLEAEDQGDRLSHQELIDLVENLMFAGHDTTRSGIAVALKVLAEAPAVYDALRHDRSLADQAVDEVLRYENIIFTSVREASEDLDFVDHVVPAGTPLAVCLPAASRDPRRFSSPDVVDIRRPQKPVNFGVGIHYCLGAYLAQAEMREVVRSVATHCRAIHLAEPVEWVPQAHIRRMTAVTLDLETA